MISVPNVGMWFVRNDQPINGNLFYSAQNNQQAFGITHLRIYGYQNSIKCSYSSRVYKNPAIKHTRVVIERVSYMNCYYSRGGGRRWQSARGFSLNLRQFTIRRLQVRLFYLIRFFSRWKFRCEQASHLLKKGIGNSCSNNCYNHCIKGTKRRTAMLESGRSRSYYDSSNSFYSELAIRECLEFIKMTSSLSSDEQAIHQQMVKTACCRFNL